MISTTPQALQVNLQVQPQPTLNQNMNPRQFTVADKTEIYKAKMGASAWAAYFGFWKTGWDALFYNPQKAASKRLDVLEGKRSFQSGVALEKEKKKAQQKASLLPAIIVTIPSVLTAPQYFKHEKKYWPELFHLLADYSKQKLSYEALQQKLDDLMVRIELEPLKKEIRKIKKPWIPIKWGTLILAPLLYALLEKPDSPDFNKGL
jgi:hypothetical protein